MSQSKPVEYVAASPDIKAVYDDIKKMRGVDDVNIRPRPGARA